MRSRVVIAGGGVASLEAALALRDLAGDRVQVDVFSPRRDFVYRPYAVGEPYGTARVARYRWDDLADRCGADFHCDSIASVDAEAGIAVTHDGEKHEYDHLVLAPGAQALWPVPGAITFWGIADEHDVGAVMGRLLGGEIDRVVFTTPGIESWALPIYELALLTDSQLAGAGVRDVALTIVTPEDSPLQVFGRQASETMAALLAARGIEVVTGTHPVRFEGGSLRVVPDGSIDADVAISLPKLQGRRIRGVLHDPDGFIRIDDHCRAIGRARIFAAGDVTSFPVKQGGIATQQADVIAEAVASDLGADLEPRPFDPVLRAVLWTGEEPLYLEGWLGGGRGEASTLGARPPWGRDEGKIVGRYLTSFIAEVDRSLSAAESAETIGGGLSSSSR